MQRAHALGAAQRDGDVEQADRVAPAGEHRHDVRALGQQAVGPHPLAHLGDRHGRRTLPFQRKRVEQLDRLGEALQADFADQLEAQAVDAVGRVDDGRVTSTSPPAALATTRAAWLTSRP